ncbi:aldehyde dehydrogenase family protein, partial [Pseudomonas protegens]
MNTAHADAVLYFVNPGYLPSASRRTREVFDPATLERIGVIPLCDKADVDAAIAVADAARIEWRAFDGRARGRLLHEVAETIEQSVEHGLEVACLMGAETGRSFSDAMAELAGCARVFRHYAELASEESNDVLSSLRSLTLQHRHYEPYGISVHILGVSQPLLLMCRTVAASLAAGNSCIVKPAETAALCTLKFMEYFRGLPSGLVSCLPGDGLTAQLL